MSHLAELQDEVEEAAFLCSSIETHGAPAVGGTLVAGEPVVPFGVFRGTALGTLGTSRLVVVIFLPRLSAPICCFATSSGLGRNYKTYVSMGGQIEPRTNLAHRTCSTQHRR